MKPRTLIIALATWLATVAPALAQAQAREDHSGILVWAFLGMCALIVVAQVLPAVLMMVGLVKGLASKKTEAEVRAK